MRWFGNCDCERTSFCCIVTCSDLVVNSCCSYCCTSWFCCSCITTTCCAVLNCVTRRWCSYSYGTRVSSTVIYTRVVGRRCNNCCSINCQCTNCLCYCIVRCYISTRTILNHNRGYCVVCRTNIGDRTSVSDCC